MEELLRLAPLLVAALFALAQGLRKKQAQAKAKAAPPEAGPPRGRRTAAPPLPPPTQGAAEIAASALKRLDAAAALPAAGRPRALQEAIDRLRDRIRALPGEGSRSGEAPPWEDPSREAGRLLRRARLLEGLARQHAEAEHGPLLCGAAVAVEACVPELEGRVVVARHGSPEHGDEIGDGLVVLSLEPGVRRRPWEMAELVEEAWGHALLDRVEPLSEAAAEVAEALPESTAMERFTKALVMAWMPALLVDAAATLSLGSAHATGLRRRLQDEKPETLFAVRLDAARRVEARPPAGLRLLLLAGLLRRLGLSEGADRLGPPPPPGAVLHLRGPGVWDEVALGPILETGGTALGALASWLSRRPGLSETASVEQGAHDLLRRLRAGERPSSSRPREILAAHGLSGAEHLEPAAAKSLLELLAPPRSKRKRRKKAQAARPAAAGRPGPAPEARTSDSRARGRAVQQALLLGAALDRRLR